MSTNTLPPNDEVRINARLTGEDARHFLELQRREGNRAASDLLRDALREYYVAHAKPKRSAFGLMQDSGFIGGGEGSRDLSTRYKSILTESLGDKFPRRVSESRVEYNAKRRR